MNPTFVSPAFKPFLPDRSIAELFVPERDEISFGFLTDESAEANKYVRLPTCSIVFEHRYSTLSVIAYGNWQSIQETDYRQVERTLYMLMKLYGAEYLVEDVYAQFVFKNAIVSVAGSPSEYGLEPEREDRGQLFCDLLENIVQNQSLAMLNSEITCYGEPILIQRGPETFYPYSDCTYNYCVP